MLTHRCLLGKAPVYLSNWCILVAKVATRQHLRSAARHQLTVCCTSSADCLLHVISWLFRDIVLTLTVVRHSLSLVRWRSTLCQLTCETPLSAELSLVRWRSTLCQLICETPLSAEQPSDNCWKHTFSLPISSFSALGVSHIMRYINLRYLLTFTYLLTQLSFKSLPVVFLFACIHMGVT